MSNAIQIDSIATFTADEFNITKFIDLMNKPEISNNKFTPIWPGTPEYDETTYFAWWFLHNIWKCNPEKNVIHFSFGNGRSAHTNRDFNALLSFLGKQFAIRPIVFFVDLRDEYDGFKKTHYERKTIKPN